MIHQFAHSTHDLCELNGLIDGDTFFHEPVTNKHSNIAKPSLFK